MALNAAIQWEVRTTGSDNNGGGFKAGATGTDYSQQDAAQVNIDNSAIVCSTPAANSNTLTFVSGYTPTSADVGNVVQISGGTNVNADFYEITAQTSTTWTVASRGGQNLTTATAAGSSITGKMGGALATPTKAWMSATAIDNVVYLKSGSYPTAALTLPAGMGHVRTIGYGVTRGDNGTKPVIVASGIASGGIMVNSGSAVLPIFENIDFDGANGTNLNCMASQNYCIRCKFRRWTATCMNTGGFGSVAILCEFTGNSGSFCFGNWVPSAFYCSFHHNTCPGLVGAGGYTVVGCQFYRNTGATTDGMQASAAGGGIIADCDFAFNGRHGLSLTATGNMIALSNLLVYGNGGWGINTAVDVRRVVGERIAFGSNASGNYNSAQFDIPSIVTLTADPFIDSVNDNYTLNAAVGGGALARSILRITPDGLTSSYPDIGAYQHQDSGGGGSAAQRSFVF
jgi:hypothetical protein